jgi:hypothetical protein
MALADEGPAEARLFVEEDLFVVTQPWRLSSSWASLYTDSNRVFPSPQHRPGEDDAHRGAGGGGGNVRASGYAS